MLDIQRVLASAPRKHEAEPMMPLQTPWSESASSGVPLPEHPRPQFARSAFLPLNGTWEYAFDDSHQTPAITRVDDAPATFDGNIVVPFSPEAPLSGVGKQLKPSQLLWYRLAFQVESAPFGATASSKEAASECETVAYPTDAPSQKVDEPRIVRTQDGMLLVKQGQRCLLHFGGVDFECAVWLNGTRMAQHKGAYLPFSIDVTDTLAQGENELLVCVADPSDAGTQLRGKQKLERGGIWYTAQSGIWQPVWLEAVPQTCIERLNITADMHGDLTVEVMTSQPAPPMKVTIFSQCKQAANQAAAEEHLACETRHLDDREEHSVPHSEEPYSQHPSLRGAASLDEHESTTRFMAEVDANNPRLQTARLHVEGARLWSPDNPNLYALELRCGDDKVQSYCAFRSVEIAPDAQGTPRFHLNGKPYFLRGVLDQGYWPDGLLTAPSDEALAYDVATMKSLGFNMLRKHIKVENERWYWHCDRLGMLVWQDMPSGGGRYDSWHTSHKPTLFRSSWAAQRDDAPKSQAKLSGDSSALQEDWLDTCRTTVNRLGNHPCIVTWVLFNEGWGQFSARNATVMVQGLDPTRPIDATSGWYDQACGDYWSVHNYFRPLAVWPDPRRKLHRAFVISEFGGLTWHVPEHSALQSSYGYASFDTLGEWRKAVLATLAQADELEARGLSGYVFTQLSDVEEEANGLLTYDRKVNKLSS